VATFDRGGDAAACAWRLWLAPSNSLPPIASAAPALGSRTSARCRRRCLQDGWNTHTQCSDRRSRSRDEQAKDRDEHKRLLLCDAVIDLAKCVGVAYIGEPSIYTRVKPPKMSKARRIEGRVQSRRKRPDCPLQIKRYNSNNNKGKAGSFSLL
jgi:hypothetical protein